MFEGLLSELLEALAGSYILSFDKKHLKVAVWKGDVTLHDVQLNPSAIVSETSCMEVVAASVGTLRLKVPWKKLKTERIDIEASNVNVLVKCIATPSPGDLYNGRRSREQEHCLRKRWKPESVRSKKRGFVGKVLEAVVDNVHITLKQIHFRVEDTITLPGKCMCTGVYVSEADFVTTDSQWEPKFIRSHSRVFKVMRLDGACVYFAKDCTDLFHVLPPDVCGRAMTGGIDGSDQYQYICAPTGLHATASIRKHGDAVHQNGDMEDASDADAIEVFLRPSLWLQGGGGVSVDCVVGKLPLTCPVSFISMVSAIIHRQSHARWSQECASLNPGVNENSSRWHYALAGVLSASTLRRRRFAWGRITVFRKRMRRFVDAWKRLQKPGWLTKPSDNDRGTLQKEIESAAPWELFIFQEVGMRELSKEFVCQAPEKVIKPKKSTAGKLKRLFSRSKSLAQDPIDENSQAFSGTLESQPAPVLGPMGNGEDGDVDSLDDNSSVDIDDMSLGSGLLEPPSFGQETQHEDGQNASCTGKVQVTLMLGHVALIVLDDFSSTNSKPHPIDDEHGSSAHLPVLEAHLQSLVSQVSWNTSVLEYGCGVETLSVVSCETKKEIVSRRFKTDQRAFESDYDVSNLAQWMQQSRQAAKGDSDVSAPADSSPLLQLLALSSASRQAVVGCLGSVDIVLTDPAWAKCTSALLAAVTDAKDEALDALRKIRKQTKRGVVMAVSRHVHTSFFWQTPRLIAFPGHTSDIKLFDALPGKGTVVIDAGEIRFSGGEEGIYHAWVEGAQVGFLLSNPGIAEMSLGSTTESTSIVSPMVVRLDLQVNDVPDMSPGLSGKLWLPEVSVALPHGHSHTVTALLSHYARRMSQRRPLLRNRSQGTFQASSPYQTWTCRVESFNIRLSHDTCMPIKPPSDNSTQIFKSVVSRNHTLLALSGIQVDAKIAGFEGQSRMLFAVEGVSATENRILSRDGKRKFEQHVKCLDIQPRAIKSGSTIQGKAITINVHSNANSSSTRSIAIDIMPVVLRIDVPVLALFSTMAAIAHTLSSEQKLGIAIASGGDPSGLSRSSPLSLDVELKISSIRADLCTIFKEERPSSLAALLPSNGCIGNVVLSSIVVVSKPSFRSFPNIVASIKSLKLWQMAIAQRMHVLALCCDSVCARVCDTPEDSVSQHLSCEVGHTYCKYHRMQSPLFYQFVRSAMKESASVFKSVVASAHFGGVSAASIAMQAKHSSIPFDMKFEFRTIQGYFPSEVLDDEFNVTVINGSIDLFTDISSLRTARLRSHFASDLAPASQLLVIESGASSATVLFSSSASGREACIVDCIPVFILSAINETTDSSFMEIEVAPLAANFPPEAMSCLICVSCEAHRCGRLLQRCVLSSQSPACWGWVNGSNGQHSGFTEPLSEGEVFPSMFVHVHGSSLTINTLSVTGEATFKDIDIEVRSTRLDRSQGIHPSLLDGTVDVQVEVGDCSWLSSIVPFASLSNAWSLKSQNRWSVLVRQPLVGDLFVQVDCPASLCIATTAVGQAIKWAACAFGNVPSHLRRVHNIRRRHALCVDGSLWSSMKAKEFVSVDFSNLALSITPPVEESPTEREMQCPIAYVQVEMSASINSEIQFRNSNTTMEAKSICVKCVSTSTGTNDSTGRTAVHISDIWLSLQDVFYQPISIELFLSGEGVRTVLDPFSVACLRLISKSFSDNISLTNFRETPSYVDSHFGEDILIACFDHLPALSELPDERKSICDGSAHQLDIGKAVVKIDQLSAQLASSNRQNGDVFRLKGDMSNCVLEFSRASSSNIYVLRVGGQICMHSFYTAQRAWDTVMESTRFSVSVASKNRTGDLSISINPGLAFSACPRHVSVLSSIALAFSRRALAASVDDALHGRKAIHLDCDLPDSDDTVEVINQTFTDLKIFTVPIDGAFGDQYPMNHNGIELPKGHSHQFVCQHGDLYVCIEPANGSWLRLYNVQLFPPKKCAIPMEFESIPGKLPRLVSRFCLTPSASQRCQVILSSGVKICNLLDCGIEIGMGGTDLTVSHAVALRHRDSCFLPLWNGQFNSMAVRCSNDRWNPSNSLFHFDTALDDSQGNNSGKTIYLDPAGTRVASLSYAVKEDRWVISTPTVIVNQLPCWVRCVILSDESGDVVDKAEIPPGESYSSLTVDSRLGHRVAFKVTGGTGFSSPVRLCPVEERSSAPQETREVSEVLTLPLLKAAMRVMWQRSLPFGQTSDAIEAKLTSRHWFVNLSGFNIYPGIPDMVGASVRMEPSAAPSNANLFAEGWRYCMPSTLKTASHTKHRGGKLAPAIRNVDEGCASPKSPKLPSKFKDYVASFPAPIPVFVPDSGSGPQMSFGIYKGGWTDGIPVSVHGTSSTAALVDATGNRVNLSIEIQAGKGFWRDVTIVVARPKDMLVNHCKCDLQVSTGESVATIDQGSSLCLFLGGKSSSCMKFRQLDFDKWTGSIDLQQGKRQDAWFPRKNAQSSTLHIQKHTIGFSTVYVIRDDGYFPVYVHNDCHFDVTFQQKGSHRHCSVKPDGGCVGYAWDAPNSPAILVIKGRNKPAELNLETSDNQEMDSTSEGLVFSTVRKGRCLHLYISEVTQSESSHQHRQASLSSFPVFDKFNIRAIQVRVIIPEVSLSISDTFASEMLLVHLLHVSATCIASRRIAKFVAGIETLQIDDMHQSGSERCVARFPELPGTVIDISDEVLPTIQFEDEGNTSSAGQDGLRIGLMLQPSSQGAAPIVSWLTVHTSTGLINLRGPSVYVLEEVFRMFVDQQHNGEDEVVDTDQDILSIHSSSIELDGEATASKDQDFTSPNRRQMSSPVVFSSPRTRAASGIWSSRSLLSTEWMDQREELVIDTLMLDFNVIKATFMPTYGTLTKQSQQRLQGIGLSISEFENAHINFGSMIMNGVYASPKELRNNVGKHVAAQAALQIHQVVLSSSLFGDPAGLLRGISTEVQTVKSGASLGKGISSIMRSSVGGTLLSARKIVDSVGDGIAMLSLDNDYIRARRHRREHRSDTDVVRGALHVGNDIKQGVSSLASLGQQSSSSGSGFSFSGFGKSLIGLAVKPVAGVLESVASVAEAARSATSHESPQQTSLLPIRHRRADSERGILEAYGSEASRSAAVLSAIEAFGFKNGVSDASEMFPVDVGSCVTFTTNAVAFCAVEQGRWVCSWCVTNEDILQVEQFGSAVHISLHGKLIGSKFKDNKQVQTHFVSLPTQSETDASKIVEKIEQCLSLEPMSNSIQVSNQTLKASASSSRTVRQSDEGNSEKVSSLSTGTQPGRKRSGSKSTVDRTVQMTFVTGKSVMCGTTATVWVKCFGQRGSVQRVAGSGSDGNFSVGSSTKCTIDIGDIGCVKRIDVWHDDSGWAPGWFLEKIVLHYEGDQAQEDAVEFICNDWLAEDESDGRIRRELYPSN